MHAYVMINHKETGDAVCGVCSTKPLAEAMVRGGEQLGLTVGWERHDVRGEPPQWGFAVLGALLVLGGFALGILASI